VVSGPNTGTTGTAVTGDDGTASFTYTSSTDGTDTIRASALDGETTVTSNDATKTWTPVVTTGLDVTNTSEPGTVSAGQSVLQTFTVTNSSDADATSSTLNVTFPAGATVESNDPSQGSCTAGPASLSCALGTIPAGGNATVAVVVTVPDGFAPGPFTPTATASSDQSGTSEFGDLTGSQVVASGGGQAFGFVPPGGSITTGNASPEFPTAATFTLPNTGTGSPISLTTEPTTPTFCGNQSCRGQLLTLSPFSGGYTDPRHPPVLDISLDRSVVRRFGPAFRVYVQKEDSTAAPVLVPDCRSLRFGGWFWWHHHWWSFRHGARVAKPSPCVSRRFFDRQGDSHVEILILQGDPKFGRR